MLYGNDNSASLNGKKDSRFTPEKLTFQFKVFICYIKCAIDLQNLEKLDHF